MEAGHRGLRDSLPILRGCDGIPKSPKSFSISCQIQVSQNCRVLGEIRVLGIIGHIPERTGGTISSCTRNAKTSMFLHHEVHMESTQVVTVTFTPGDQWAAVICPDVATSTTSPGTRDVISGAPITKASSLKMFTKFMVVVAAHSIRVHWRSLV